MTKIKQKKYNTTMLELHSNKLKEFDKLQKKLPDKKKLLTKLESSSKPNLEKIEKLKKEIKRLENEEDLTEYLLDIQHVLKMQCKMKEEKRLSNLKKKDNQDLSAKIGKDGNYSMKSFISGDIDNTTSEILDAYTLATSGTVSHMLSREKAQYTSNDFVCENCGSDNTVTDKRSASITCVDCSVSRDWQDPNIPQFSKETKASRTYRYKPEWYFMEHLNRFQAKETVKLEDGLIESIYDELLKNNIYSKNKITSTFLRKILKNLNKTNYYDNLNTIRKMITGEKAPHFSQEVERKLCAMFAMIKEPYEKWKNIIKDRNNFLYYPYVTRNLVILLSKSGHPEIGKYKNYFRPLKNEEKMKEQEKVWEKICDDCGWPFYESMSEWPWKNE